jgi:hypothetical protein
MIRDDKFVKGRTNMMCHGIKHHQMVIRVLSVILLMLASTLHVTAGQFDFIASPQTDLNRVYRIDRVTGEVGACQYGLKEGSLGVTLCFPSGEGAGRQEPSEFALIASRHEREGGVFRVDQRTGAMSVCYVYEDKVVCTPPEKGAVHPTRQAPAGEGTTSGAKR